MTQISAQPKGNDAKPKVEASDFQRGNIGQIFRSRNAAKEWKGIENENRDELLASISDTDIVLVGPKGEEFASVGESIKRGSFDLDRMKMDYPDLPWDSYMGPASTVVSVRMGKDANLA